VVTQKAIQERDKVLVETTAETMVNVKDTNKTSYELWKEDKKKRDEKQEKQNLIFELEKTKKELESTQISTDVIEETIKLLSKEILEGSK
jgi:predicted nucleic acid-binding protein